MLLKLFTVATAGLVAVTQAFLLPPDISDSDIDIVSSLPDPKILTIPQHINLNVTCPGCLFPHKGKHHGGVQTTSEKPSHLELAFSVDHSLDGDKLLVNGFPLYPKANPFTSSPKAAVVPDANLRPAIKELRGHRPRPHPEQELGYQLSVRQKISNDKDGLSLYDVELHIIEVGDVFVDGIPSVHVTLVKDIVTGNLAIGSIETTEPKTTAVSTPKEGCTTFTCKWLSTMKDNMAKMKGKGCHGKIRGGAHETGPHHGGHHHHKGHRPHKMQEHSYGQLLKEIGQHILLPVAVGIIAGISVSLIGMMVGTLIVSVWRLLFRRPGHRRRSSHSRCHRKASKTEAAAAEAEEKSGLMEHQGPPPSYDEEALPMPPVYEEEKVISKTNV